MKRYNLGSHALIENVINQFNTSNNDKALYSISGLLINQNYQFSAVVEYYELETHESLDLDKIKNEINGSAILATKLDIPMFIVTYKENTDYMEIHNYFNGNKFSKSIIKPHNDDCEFIKWWNQYKGTVQTKPIYNKDYKKWKINNILDESETETSWGGDIDGIVIENNDICSIIEFRKSTKELVEKYDPAKYFNGIGDRKGDYYTWKPLITLKDQLSVPLKLVTLSEADTKNYGVTQVESISRTSLKYLDDKSPNKNMFNNINDLIINI